MSMATLERTYPLTPMQQGMLFHSQLAPRAGIYLQQLVVTLPESVDADALCQAWQLVAQRHEVLRVALVVDEQGDLAQRPTDEVELPFAELDFSDCPRDEQEQHFQEFLDADRARGFDPADAPLARVTLIHRGDADFVLVWTYHHALLDGRSHRQVLEEAFTAYEAFRDGAYPSLVPVRPFSAHVEWLLRQDAAAAERYWRELLRGFRTPTPLPAARTAPESGDPDIAEYETRVPGATLAALKDFAERNGVTLNTLLQGAWAILLCRYSGEDDVVFGTTRSGRRPDIERGRPTVGLLINTLPVRAKVRADRPLLDWLKELRAQWTAGRPVDYAPPVRVQEWSEVPRGTPLYDSILVLENYHLDAAFKARGGAWAQRDIQLRERPHFPLTVAAYAGDDLRVILHYDRRRVDEALAGRLLGHLVTLLGQMPAHADRPVRELPMLTSAERQTVLYDWNDTAAPFPDNVCLDQLVEAQVDRTPDAVAVLHDGQAWTYRELDERANRLAHHLRGLGAGPGTLVGVCMNRSAEMVVAVLGLLKAGAAYVPIDPANPKERLSFLLRDTGAAALVTQVRRLERLPEVSVPVVCIDGDWPTLSVYPADRPERRTTSADRAYVIYTSGSTGTPKGVVLRHRAVVNTLDWVNTTFGVGPADRVLWVTSLCFDLSVYDIFGVLAAGGSVRVATGSELRDPERLLDVLCDEPITFWDSAPSLLAQLAPHFARVRGRAAQARLRLVFLSGDWIPVALPDQVRASFPGARVVSLGGATEAAIWSNYYPIGQVDPAWASIPYGRPIRNARYYLLDVHGQPAPVGVPAELYIAGECLADGYLNRPELTAEKFISRKGAKAQSNTEDFTPLRLCAFARDRLYKTGDRAKYWPDGTIEFLGRIDYQVKIRGFRIELGEVEATLAKCPGVRQVVAAAVPDAAGERQLVAYVVPQDGREPNPGDLRRFLQDRLPDYLVPSHFVTLAQLPLNANGKVDRKSLPPPERRGAVRNDAQPRDAAERAIATAWCEVLGLDRVGIHDNFFELGGHSLKAAQVVSRVRQRLGRDLPLAAFFRTPTIAALRLALEDGAAPAASAPAAPAASRAPASPAQRQLWFLDRLGQSSEVYTIAYALHLDGETDPGALRAALVDLAERHEALRISFAEEGGELWQVVAPPGSVDLPLVDLTDRPSEERPAAARRLAEALVREEFDAERGPLWRVRLVRMSEHQHQLHWAFHHLIADGQSLAVLVRDLAALYAARRTAQPAALPAPGAFTAYSRWLASELSGGKRAESLAAWKERLTPPPKVLTLPTARPRPAIQSFRGATLPAGLAPETMRAVEALAQSEGSTPFAVLLAAFQALLYRYTGQDDFAVGSPVLNRTRPEAEKLVGPLVNTLVLRADLSGTPTFREVLGRARAVVQQALAHQEVPFDLLVQELRPQRDASHPPFFQVLFSYAPEVPAVAPAGATWTPEQITTRTAKFDLSLWLGDRPDGPRGYWEYNTDLFDADAVGRLAGHFDTLLGAALADPDARVSELPLLSDAERRQLLHDWNDTASDYPRDRCAHELIAEQAARTPDAVAVRHDGRELTYRELNEQANRLAHHLRTLGVGPDVPVGLYLDHSADLVVSALAVWKAGGAYLPLDPSFPAERLAFYVRDSHAPVIVTNGGLADRLPEHRATLVRLDAQAEALREYPATDLAPAATPEHMAYVLYTSGSTGTPKGVMVLHRGLTNFLWSMRLVPGCMPADRFLAITTPGFDIHALELWLPLVVGARTEVVGRDEAADVLRLVRKIGEVRPTVLQATPATWRLLLTAGWEGDPRLTILCGGEALTADLAAPLRERCGKLWNLFGPTETTVWSTVYLDDGADGPVPIGRPIANTQVYILDQHRQLVPAGVPGELVIGGDGVARGYLNRPELTAEKFISRQAAKALSDSNESNSLRLCGFARDLLYKTGDLARWRPDGVLEYLGRIDHQVKVRGFRIELGEVEAVLAKHPGVRHAVVVARREGGGNESLSAYVVADPGASPTADDLRRFVRDQLPEYMVPTHVTFLAELPLTPNGKVDRGALPAPDAPAAETARAKVAPRNDVERDLAALWEEVLGVRPVGIHDDFFDLGGHSYLAAVLMARIKQRLGHTLPLGTLFNAPTVEKLSAVLQRRLEAGSKRCLIPFREDGAKPAVFLIAGVGGHVFAFHKFARLLGPDRPVYGLKAVGVDGQQEPLETIEEIARRYVAEINEQYPRGPVVLGGYSVGALIALELALQFQKAGRSVGPLLVFDMNAPGYPRQMPLPRRLAIHTANLLLGRTPGGRRAYLRERVQNVRGRVLNWLGLTVWNAPEIRGVEALPQQALKRVWAALHLAQKRYWPQGKFAGRVLLFKAEEAWEWAATSFDDPHMGWDDWVTGGVEEHVVPGGHLDMFRDANQPHTAAVLNERLDVLMPAPSHAS